MLVKNVDVLFWTDVLESVAIKILIQKVQNISGLNLVKRQDRKG